jgi:hypothetical protein
MYNPFQKFLQPIAWKKPVIIGDFPESAGEVPQLEADIAAVMVRAIFKRGK